MKPALVSVKSALPALLGRHCYLWLQKLELPGYGMHSGWYLDRPSPVFIQRRSGHLPSPSIMCSNYLDAGTTLALGGCCGFPRPPVEAYMKTSTLAWSLVAGLAFTAAPLHAQHVSGEVVVHGGPVAGRVVVDDGYSSYRRPARRVVVERYAPRVVRVERFRHRHGKHWRRNGYREVIVYYIDGRYYDRAGWDHPRAHEVIVYQRDGRFYTDARDRDERDDRDD